MNNMNKMTYKEFKKYMYNFNKENWPHKEIKGVIVFKEDNYPDDNYSLESRSYEVSSDNKALRDAHGYSLLGSALDGSDSNVRLEQYIDVEYGGKDGWRVDYCYLIENVKEEK